MVAHWILTANPDTYRIFDALRDGYPIGSWRIAHLRNEIAPGDEFALWASHRDESIRGAYALGVVTRSAEYGLTGPDPYWTNPAENENPILHVGIRIDENLVDGPIVKTELANDHRFAGALVLRMAGGRNPFTVTDAQWKAILSHQAKRAGIRRRSPSRERPPSEYEITFKGTVIGHVRRAAAGSRAWWLSPRTPALGNGSRPALKPRPT
jgi:hypothetical protein